MIVGETRREGVPRMPIICAPARFPLCLKWEHASSGGALSHPQAGSLNWQRGRQIAGDEELRAEHWVAIAAD